ncbi:MAG: hypothetical protein CVV47_13485 [Spirochaetae bacterium HGW-Spirochaetae-3]|jgi:hypothetical protein|nr:MAG: hypothetical protein CVV47_13485 [Spirochaetae bacterium HGW-Spirochaetae-3]
MKAKPYECFGCELEFTGSQENWDYISEALAKHKIDAEKELDFAKAEYAKSVEREERVKLLMTEREHSEHLFYKIHLFLTQYFEEADAERLATNIIFLRNPPQSLHGMVHRTIKKEGLTLSTKKASYLFDDISDHLMHCKSVLWVSICYLQDYTFFMFSYYYDIIEKRIAKGYTKPLFSIVDTDKAIRMLKTRRLLNKFKKSHPAVYAAYLMDK